MADITTRDAGSGVHLPAAELGKGQREDFGFFGPGSPTWQVWTAPTALIGFQRAVVLEHFDPFLAASVADMQGIYRDPAVRLDHTLAYFLTVATADGRTATALADHLAQVHKQSTGIEPVSGKRYSANSPESQLWIHITGWHSVLKCYEMYGPGKLSDEDERRYWAECAIAAELQTCKSTDVPTTRDGVRAYFAEVRPRLCTSERANKAMHYLLRTPVKRGGLQFAAGSRLIAPLAIASLPNWMRELGGFDQPAVMDKAVTPLARVAVRVASRPRFELAILKALAPGTGRVLSRHLHATAPAFEGTVTPAQVRAWASAESVASSG
ncbi:oxygenase MpaB family protein [Tomitella biformata]|uniref:oxygenase MpaB family protein n=1 Tax=Tomitella biformata TaxID=630403 RepID=UPI0004639085|nr:oxygenase MpaB family protein [Tomitella biformata]